MPRLVSRLDMLPIRWRLAATSAILTFAILLLFAIVIGFFTARQLRASFDRSVRQTADELQARVDVRSTVDGRFAIRESEKLVELASAGGVVVRILQRNGDVLGATEGAPDLGPPTLALRDSGQWRVVARPLERPFGRPIAYVQYARSREDLTDTIRRVHLFLAFGVIGGTALALLAGMAVARRAMAPIAGLTRTAKEVGRTRDPDVTLPHLRAEDEVADLSRTLEQMLASLGDAQDETADALARQREFVADASHELRTPLTSILANLELLEAELTGEEHEIAESALRSSQRMRRLVADLLLLARADAGRQAPREPVDLAAVVREAAAEVLPLAERHGVTIEAEGPVTVEGSADDLHRLVLNLLQNALVHTPAGTNVAVRLTAGGDGALIEVQDDGPGIPAELRHRLFERFVRGEGDEGSSGSGLGLAIVRAVAEAHGGAVAVEEAPDGGARFIVSLPPARARQTVAA